MPYLCGLWRFANAYVNCNSREEKKGDFMEYYIMKVYKDEKEKCPDIQNGFNQYDSKAKKGIIICFVEMILGGIIVTLSMPLQWKLIWQILGVILLIVAVLSLLIIENKNEKSI